MGKCEWLECAWLYKVHPVYRLNGRGRQSLRLACFRLGGDISLLPAFGAFTGGYQVERDDDCRIFVIGDNEVWPVYSPL